MARYCWTRESAFDFIREKVMECCNELPSVKEQLSYLNFVLLEKKNRPPELDENIGLKPTFEEFIQNEINFRKEELSLRKLCLDKRGNEPAEQDLIWWKGTEPQMIYFFELLFRAGLIEQTQYQNRFSLIENHFKNKNSVQFNNLQLASANQNMIMNKTGKPKSMDAEAIELILKETRDMIKGQTFLPVRQE
ncbi:MAG: hypothetical protein ACYDA4_08620 [Ignavibacteriaceae bacterium]